MYDYPDDDGDDDYRINEGYTQRSERSHGRLIDLSDINPNQMISARISEQGSVFSTNDESRPRHVGCRQAASRVASTERTYPTLLTFISGALVGGNYDSYSNQYFGDAQDTRY